MKRVFFAGTEEVSHFSIECNCGEQIFSHQFEFLEGISEPGSRGHYTCPHCCKVYTILIYKNCISLMKHDVSDN